MLSDRLARNSAEAAWVVAGQALVFLVVSDHAEVQYKTTDYWAPQHERCILWNDHDLAISWPLDGDPILSPKDRAGRLFKQAEVFP